MPRRSSATVDLKIRMKEPLRREVERAAKQKGISMNAELIERVEAAGRGERRLAEVEEMLGGREIFGILMVIGRAMRETGVVAGFSARTTLGDVNRWFLNPYAYDQAVKAATAVLEAMRPPGDIAPPSFMSG